jgi:hypothetical protein
MLLRVHTVAASLVFSALAILPSSAANSDVVVGINFTHPLQLSNADQDASLARLKSAGVHVIRIGLFAADIDKGVDFIQRANAQGIKVLLTVHSQYPSNAPIRPYKPKEFPGKWSGVPLSYADPELSRRFFQELMDKLDTNGIALAGLELENEINHPGFNAEFSLPGEGKNLGLDDFYHDPEGRQIAKGYLQYIRVLTVLKQVRDHSRFNRNTPLISAGLSPTGPAGPWSKNVDAANPNATIQFLRANGLDQLVDGYGIHIYPSKDHPGDPAAAARRLQALRQADLAECSASGKRCWVTEWGFTNDSNSCPPVETVNLQLIQELTHDFRLISREGRLAGAFYYTWTGEALFDVYRCGALTEGGRLALQPIQ